MRFREVHPIAGYRDWSPCNRVRHENDVGRQFGLLLQELLRVLIQIGRRPGYTRRTLVSFAAKSDAWSTKSWTCFTQKGH